MDESLRVGRTLTSEEADALVDSRELVDSMRLNPNTMAGKNIRDSIDDMRDAGFTESDILGGVARKISEAQGPEDVLRAMVIR